jgi:hypothetical protein
VLPEAQPPDVRDQVLDELQLEKKPLKMENLVFLFDFSTIFGLKRYLFSLEIKATLIFSA